MGHVADADAGLGRVLFLCGPCRNRVAATDRCDVPGGDRQPRAMGLYALTRQIMPRDGRRFRGVGVAPMQIATGQVTAVAVLFLPLLVLV